MFLVARLLAVRLPSSSWSHPARLQTTANHDVIITIETRREKTDCWLFCSKQTLRQPRNGVTDWSIAQLLTNHCLVYGEIANNKNNLSNGYLTEGNCCKFPQGKRIQGNLTGFKESVEKKVVYVLFINRFKLLGFNWLIKLPWQLRCPQTEQKSQQSLTYSPGFFLLGLTPSFLAASGFAACLQ